MSLTNLGIILDKPRFPENIGMAARACANFGCSSLALIAPQRWNYHASQALATPQGHPILENMRIYPTLKQALADVHTVYGTTARLGGWRKQILSPAQAAEQIVKNLYSSETVRIVFGPEDRGLANQEIINCDYLIHIPTQPRASSLNLAQSVLIILYECFMADKNICAVPNLSAASPNHGSHIISHEEFDIFETAFKNILQDLQCLHGKNPDYCFIQWRNLFRRAKLRRHEFDALMGLCRQIANKLQKLQS